jgi:hypothetical protein
VVKASERQKSKKNAQVSHRPDEALFDGETLYCGGLGVDSTKDGKIHKVVPRLPKHAAHFRRFDEAKAAC